MVQFNLLPDVKIEYIKAQRLRQMVIGISFIVTAAAITILVLLLSVDGLQRKHLSDLSNDITTDSKTLQGEKDINTILTVQNQLQSLTALHAAKPNASRLYGYLNSLTPAKVSINNLTADFTLNTLKISGTADALSSVNQYVDTLKLTKYTLKDDPAQLPAFSNVVLTSFGLTTSSDKSKTQTANYTIDLVFDKNIFDTTKTVTLVVPSITTREKLQNATTIFDTTNGSNP